MMQRGTSTEMNLLLKTDIATSKLCLRILQYTHD